MRTMTYLPLGSALALLLSVHILPAQQGIGMGGNSTTGNCQNGVPSGMSQGAAQGMNIPQMAQSMIGSFDATGDGALNAQELTGALMALSQMMQTSQGTGHNAMNGMGQGGGQRTGAGANGFQGGPRGQAGNGPGFRGPR